MADLEAQAEPLAVSVRDGEVVMTGERVAVALTEDAARQTGQRLTTAADEIAGAQPNGPASDS